jgi:hypothetical protein
MSDTPRRPTPCLPNRADRPGITAGAIRTSRSVRRLARIAAKRSIGSGAWAHCPPTSTSPQSQPTDASTDRTESSSWDLALRRRARTARRLSKPSAQVLIGQRPINRRLPLLHSIFRHCRTAPLVSTTMTAAPAAPFGLRCHPVYHHLWTQCSSILPFRSAAIADWHCHERIEAGQCRHDCTPSNS